MENKFLSKLTREGKVIFWIWTHGFLKTFMTAVGTMTLYIVFDIIGLQRDP